MKDRMTLLIALMLIALVAAACGGSAATSPVQAAPATKVPATAATSTAELPLTAASSHAQPAPSACEEFFGVSGTYEMKAQTNGGISSGGMLDMFPAIEVARRTFSNGTGSTAEVTVAADGSGSLQATGLVEQASMQVSNPDPNARIDFAMQWTCQQEK